jgi:hypothetical protein
MQQHAETCRNMQCATHGAASVAYAGLARALTCPIVVLQLLLACCSCCWRAAAAAGVLQLLLAYAVDSNMLRVTPEL